MAVSITKPPLDLAHVQEWEQAISRLDADYRRHLELLETTLDLHTRSIEQYRSDHRHAQDRLDILGRILDAHITAFTSHQKLAEEQRARQERIRRALAHELLQAREENDRLKLKAAKVASGRWMRLGRFLRLASPLAVLFVIAANAQGQVIGPVVGTSSANPAYVNCVTGCSASSGPSFGSAFPSSGTPIGATDGVNMQPVKVDGSGNLLVNVAAGSGGTPTGPAGTPNANVVSVQGITGMTPVKVDGSGVTQPVSGTFWQATQPVSAASLPLPTGAATAAKQPALGTAGVASADVITVQGIASMIPLKVDGSGVTQPISGTVTSNQGGTWTVQPGNTANTTPWLATISQGGNAATVSVGGALKVDGSAATQPVSGTVTANQGGTWNVNATLGAETTKVIGVVRTADGSGNLLTSTASALDVNIKTSAASNISTNVAQMNGVAVTMGNGTAGTGVQRVVLASDNSAIANFGHGATGSAVPANATYFGALTAGNLQGVIACRSTAVLDMTTATTTQIVAASGSTAIYICELSVMANGTTTVTMKYGTGSNCGTGTTSLSPAWDLIAQSGIVEGSGLGTVYSTPASQALCFTNSAAVNAHIHVSYTQM